MLFPDEISGKRAQKRARNRAEITMTFPWLVAHLTFYDIDFAPKFTVAEFTELLADGVKQGKCNKLPSRVRAIASELEQLFKAANVEHAQIRPGMDMTPQKALTKFKIPVDLANYDSSVFLAKYFLDQDGRPDPNKTPFPVMLPGLSDRLALQQAADNVPGLKTSCGGEGEFRILVIGWNRAAIFEIAEKISADQAKLRDDMSSTWREHLREHYSLIKILPLSSKTRKFAIESARGTYAVECRGQMDRYGSSDYDESSLRVTCGKAGNWIGIFKIGVIYGVMRLDTDRKAILARCKATEKNEFRRDDLTELEATEVEDVASEEEDLFSDLSADERDEEFEPGSVEFGMIIQRKRKQASSKATTSVKRPKPSSSTSTNRIYFKWRGREQGEDDFVYDFSKDNVGYLQFTDPDCTKFESTISNDFFGKNLRFQGFKISNEGGPVTEIYRDYSEHAELPFDD